MTSYNKLIILVPTAEEAACLKNNMPLGAELIISGVGMARTAAAAACIAISEPGSMLILAGIAGAYPHSRLKPGNCVVVGGERVADQGAFRDGDFVELYNAVYHCPLAEKIKSLPVVRSNSVNAGCAPFIDSGADMADNGAFGIENMEGAAFFAVCEALGIPFLEVRAISNITTDSRNEWRPGEAIEALAAGVKKVADEISR